LFLVISSFTLIPFPSSSKASSVVIKVFAPAVSRTEKGLVGVITEIDIRLEAPGQGDVFFSVNTLTEIDMQASARVAALVASEISGKKFTSYNYYVKVISEAPIIGGPSAGALMTVGMIAAMNNWSLNPKVMMTGMINPDGTIGPVGGIFEKAEAAHEFGIRLFLIPCGQSIVQRVHMVYEKVGPIVIERQRVESINITEYALKNWNMTIREVADIREAVYYFTGHKLPLPSPMANLTTPPFIQEVLREMYMNLLSSVQSLREEVKGMRIQDAYIKGLIGKLLDESESKLNLAREYAEERSYYVAASLAFQSVYTVQYAAYLGKYASSGELVLDDIISRVNASITSAKELVTRVTPRSLVSLELLIGAKLRLESALDEFNKVVSSRGRWSIEDTLWGLAYAKWRAETARSWASLASRLPQGDIIDFNILIMIAKDYLYEAQTITIYASQITSEVGTSNELISEATASVARSKRALSEKDPVLSLAEALNAIVYSCTAMNLLSAVNQKVIRKQVEISKKLALAYLTESLSYNVTPILAFCYLEFANFSYERGDLAQALLEYKDSIAYARIICLIYRAVHEIPPPTTGEALSNTNEGQTPTPSSKNRNVGRDELLGFILSILNNPRVILAFITGLTIGIIIGVLRRKGAQKSSLTGYYPYSYIR